MIKGASRYLLTSVVILLVYSSCTQREQALTEKRTTIGIINPNVQTLVAFNSLIETGTIEIPSVSFLAICYDHVERDIRSLEEFIHNQNDQRYRLKILSGELSPQTLFQKNALTDQFHEVFTMTDGLFFLGGADIPPHVYDQKTNLLSSITTPNRHLFELSFLFHLLGGYQDSSQTPFLKEKPDYKVIGFCLGMQTLNVATGGSMYQDIPSDIYGLHFVEDVLSLEQNQRHRNYWQDLDPREDMIWSNFHQIRSVKTHPFFDQELWSLQNQPFVYSSHHQAVRKPGKNIDILATSIDGQIVEIIAHRIYKNVIGVQFHPEVASLYQPEGKKMKWSPDDEQPRSYYEFLTQTNSLTFHKSFWGKINALYSKNLTKNKTTD